MFSRQNNGWAIYVLGGVVVAHVKRFLVIMFCGREKVSVVKELKERVFFFIKKMRKIICTNCTSTKVNIVKQFFKAN